MLVATLAQVLLQELQGMGPGLTTAIEPAAAQLHRHGQQCRDLVEWPLQPSAPAPGVQCTWALLGTPCPWVTPISILEQTP